MAHRDWIAALETATPGPSEGGRRPPFDATLDPIGEGGKARASTIAPGSIVASTVEDKVGCATTAESRRKRANLATIADPTQRLAKLLVSASKKRNLGLLATGLAHLLSAATPMLEPDPPSLEAAAALGQVLAAVDAAREERTGLSFVPAVVRRLSVAMAISAAHDVLLSAARRELIELRPEGGLGRLSAEDLALCPPGPAGTRLSWARRASGVAA